METDYKVERLRFRAEMEKLLRTDPVCQRVASRWAAQGLRSDERFVDFPEDALFEKYCNAFTAVVGTGRFSWWIMTSSRRPW